MAKFRFKCEHCNTTVEKYASSSTESLPCGNCSLEMKKQFPNIGSRKTTERVNAFLNINHEEDHDKKLDDRRTKYFWEVEVPRLVESGTYSVETCLENGWLVYNEKGELEIGKGPLKK